MQSLHQDTLILRHAKCRQTSDHRICFDADVATDNRGLPDKHLPTISSPAAQFKQNNGSADAALIAPVQQGLASVADRLVHSDCPLRQCTDLRRHCVVHPLFAPTGNP
jgi:hypothetical protein